jgi:hypothetical protein
MEFPMCDVTSALKCLRFGFSDRDAPSVLLFSLCLDDEEYFTPDIRRMPGTNKHSKVHNHRWHPDVLLSHESTNGQQPHVTTHKFSASGIGFIIAHSRVSESV